ncbi:MAG: response regulator [Microbacterium sp.]
MNEAARYTVGIVEDHSLVALGVMSLLNEYGVESHLAATVSDLLALDAPLDLAILDLRLSDGSSVTSNVAQLTEAGLPVLVLTAAENVDLLREAAKAGVLGIVRKSLPQEEIRETILRALRGEDVASLEWAVALDGDPHLADARLTPREREVLALYASGETASGVAFLTGLKPGVVNNYVRRVREKYAEAGRPAPSRVDLYNRALEDRIIELGGQ